MGRHAKFLGNQLTNWAQCKLGPPIERENKVRVGVRAVEQSGNEKTGPMAVTYVAQQSCPKDCPWLMLVRGAHKKLVRACYGNRGRVGWITARLNAIASSLLLTAIMLAKQEARAIDRLSGELVLRLHIVGDSPTNTCARIVARACARYMKRFLKPVYGYTHAWRQVKRSSWGKVSMLASVQSYSEAREAMALGFAPAILLPEMHAGPKAFHVGELLVIPCPQQTGASPNCLACKLCFDDKALLARNAVIKFQPDHNTMKAIRETLIQIEREN